MDSPSQELRRRALEKIAALSSTASSTSADHADIERLSQKCREKSDRVRIQSSELANGVHEGHKSLSGAPMLLDELDVLLALCKAGPLQNNVGHAERLLDRLAPYLLDAHLQVLAPSPFVRLIEPSPWEALSYNLVLSLLTIGIKHPSLHEKVYQCTFQYLQTCRRLITVGLTPQTSGHESHEAKPLGIYQRASLSVSILGFLEAAAAYFNFYTLPERLEVISALRQILAESFMVSVEGAFSSIRTSDSTNRQARDWKYFTKHYASLSRPLGATLLQLGFMKMLVSCSSMAIASTEDLQNTDILEALLSKKQPRKESTSEDGIDLIELMSDIAAEEMRLLADGADYLQLGSAWQQHLAFAVKRYSIITFLNCMLFDEDVAEAEVLVSWLEATMEDPIQMADDYLSSAVLKSLAIVAKISPATATSLSRSIPRFIVQSGTRTSTTVIAARCLAHILQLLSQDAILTGLYSLGNLLSQVTNGEKGTLFPSSRESYLGLPHSNSSYAQDVNGSSLSLELSSGDDQSAIYGNVVHSIVTIAQTCRDEKIISLAQSMLLQKLGRSNAVVDSHIVIEAGRLAVCGGPVELRSLLRLYARLSHTALIQNNTTMLEAIMTARVILAETLKPDTPLFEAYLVHLLEDIVSKGDVEEHEHTKEKDAEVAGQEICQFLRPWAILSAVFTKASDEEVEESIENLQRDAWFNLVVHGITPGSTLYSKYQTDLRIIATHSRPLITDDRAEQFEGDIDLNTVLRRGMKGPRNPEMKQRLNKLLPSQDSHIRSLSYPKVVFLLAAYMVETLRADSGSCASILPYFLDPSVNRNEMESCMIAITDQVMSIYLRRVSTGIHAKCSASYAAEQLALILQGCCHRIAKVQQVAFTCADRLISQIPSSLSQKSSLFALLELMTLMWTGCLESETDEYEWKSTHISSLANITLQLSDDYEFRKRTLEAFYRHSREWMSMVINVAPLDVKGLLQTYLSEYDDDGAYGHIALGRSFALEMGSVIPATDQRLGAIDTKGDWRLDTGSDFIAQYTTRQEYRYANVLPEHDAEWANLLHLNGDWGSPVMAPKDTNHDAETILAQIALRVTQRKFISIGELRDVLRRAAALLCRSRKDHCGLVHHLVGIPFTLFKKASINLGVSLWLGVINENPWMESRILVEIAENWEKTIQNRLGVFSIALQHLDPFYIKEEFAPSDKSILFKRQQAVHDLIAPHLRILQFLGSHFSANRLTNPHVRRVFQRLIIKTLRGLKLSAGHPLSREFHFQAILFATNVLRHSTDLGDAARWRFKDTILSAALSWFSHPARWSFGGNKVQVKAEAQLLLDVEAVLGTISPIGVNDLRTLQSLAAKQDLLVGLLDDEHMRLHVWLNPLENNPRRMFPFSHSHAAGEFSISSAMLKVAWAESPALAIQFLARFRSPILFQNIRRMLLESPQDVIEEPEALQILLGDISPNDVASQLKYLLYWAPVNPITAVTYFLPAYSNNPFVLQYAMRTLESHSVDVTFFYVPQIVQALRYDALGYVSQYIIETAKFSQLFAHQIIWSMKANAYKDDESMIEDPIKPTLDKVMSAMITSFSGVDKDFYVREFSFFDEITDISGKLKPFIKKSKAEKKQKIEEELRKIKVEVGVYLPSNPEGVVIGIDRKSGKPLQSHAKAPYMATFRIKKNRGDMEGTDEMLQVANAKDSDQSISTEPTYEVWQSAIFKVGDDCRQDVLALQMIAAFRGIFNNVGLDVYVYPYRVTATAPGCGVIDVLPNSISRDMLGREAVNGLYDYFVSKYGGEDSIRFQEVRNNFVKSMAAYSVISYLLQFKDRHNGNIMVDDAGHILHIDFGFCFDIAPGGVRFERAPFKLTSEMVSVMGGSTTSQSYRWFEELCVKAFLASRPYAEKLVHMVVLMIDSGLPCFKPATIKHFRERFVLEKSEREAAEFMRFLVRKSYGSNSTKVYDGFQLFTNGIPY
ncbi:MAG: phosphatidylinositol-4- kinase [Icmadophila ericetorum]|nr:phosphatidylinositol-4- kinase [Icmadophila ericetorum]